MIALDTNVLARFYVLDEADRESGPQHALAVAALGKPGKFFVPKTVMLEFEWLLRGFYGYARADILRVFDQLANLPMVHIEDSDVVATAIAAYREGLDFADALHLASSAQCAKLMTFDDRGFARRAKRMKLKPDVVLLGAKGKA